MENTLQFFAEHSACRLAWTEEMVVRPDLWTTIIFSDEKKWSLDGHDGMQHYWCDLSQEMRQSNCRQVGRGLVISSWHYMYTLSEFLLLFARLHYGTEFVFQQDNASIHTSAFTKEFFVKYGVHVLDWPARSLDLNPNENLWAIMSRDVYHNGTQYENVASLIAAISAARTSISQETLVTLVGSMPHRCIEAIMKKDCKAHY